MRRHSLSPCLSQLFHGSVLWEFKIQQVKRFFNTILNYEQIPVPELHNVLSQSTRVCKFLGVIDSATNSPANCHCVPNMSDYIPICLLCDPPGTVYTFIYTWVPLSITWLLQCVAG